jgi:hypothetical protein
MMSICNDHLALWATLVLGTLCALCGSASAGQYVRVSPDLELYYEDARLTCPAAVIGSMQCSRHTVSRY